MNAERADTKREDKEEFVLWTYWRRAPWEEKSSALVFPRISRVSHECGACWCEERRQRSLWTETILWTYWRRAPWEEKSSALMFPRISRVSYECRTCWYEEKRQRGVFERRQSHGLTEDDSRHEKKKVAPWCFPEFLEFPTNAERADAKREDRGVCEPRQSHGLTEEERHEKKKVAPQCFL